jgi:hypothetical protein
MTRLACSMQMLACSTPGLACSTPGLACSTTSLACSTTGLADSPRRGFHVKVRWVTSAVRSQVTTRRAMTWSAEIRNNPAQDHDLYIELLENDE